MQSCWLGVESWHMRLFFIYVFFISTKYIEARKPIYKTIGPQDFDNRYSSLMAMSLFFSLASFSCRNFKMIYHRSEQDAWEKS